MKNFMKKLGDRVLWFGICLPLVLAFDTYNRTKEFIVDTKYYIRATKELKDC